jgi:hypothetical protein
MVPNNIFTPRKENVTGGWGKSSLRGTWGPVAVAMYCEWDQITNS